MQRFCEYQVEASALAYILCRMSRCRIVIQGILDGISRTDNLDIALLTLRRPHGDAGEETTIGKVEPA